VEILSHSLERTTQLGQAMLGRKTYW